MDPDLDFYYVIFGTSLSDTCLCSSLDHMLGLSNKFNQNNWIF